jgi:cysteine-rich repeat protein
MKKRGLSHIISIVLIVLLVLATIVIVWNIVYRTIGDRVIEVSTLTAELEIVKGSVLIDESNGIVNLNVGRKAGKGNLIGFNIVLEDIDGKTHVEEFLVDLKELEVIGASINYLTSNLGELKKISVVPILTNENGEEILGSIVDEHNVNEGDYGEAGGFVCGIDDGVCPAGCSFSDGDIDCTYCGDGLIQNPNDDGQNEECDDGGILPGDDCSEICTIEIGGGVVGSVTPNSQGQYNQNNIPSNIVVQSQFIWADLEPEQGNYDWAGVDNLLALTLDSPVAFKFFSVGGKLKDSCCLDKGNYPGTCSDNGLDCAPNDLTNCGGGATCIVKPECILENKATPQWVLDDPLVETMGETFTDCGVLAKYPKYWDDEYKAHLDDFIQEFANQYGNNERFEFIRPGGWSLGSNEPNFYRGVGEYLVTEIEADIPGYTGGNDPPAGSVYSQAVNDMMDYWINAFPNTPLVVTVKWPNEDANGDWIPSFRADFVNSATSRKLGLVNTGLNECDKMTARERFAQHRNDFGIKVGWGGITNLGSCEPGAVLLDAYTEGIGDETHQPLSDVSYVTFGLPPSGPTAEQQEAIDWALPRLRYTSCGDGFCEETDPRENSMTCPSDC